MDAEVTIKFVVPDVCDVNEIEDEFFCFEDCVTDVIENEGLYSFLETEEAVFEIVDIKKIG